MASTAGLMGSLTRPVQPGEKARLGLVWLAESFDPHASYPCRFGFSEAHRTFKHAVRSAGACLAHADRVPRSGAMLLCHNGVAKCDGRRRTWQTSECMLIRRRGGRIRELCCDGKKTRARCGHMRACYSAYASTKGRRRGSESMGRDGLSEQEGERGARVRADQRGLQ